MGEGNVKGSLMRNIVKAIKVRRGQLGPLPPELVQYIEGERIIPTLWYPAAHYVGLVAQLAAPLPPEPDPWAVLGASEAHEHVDTLYGVLGAGVAGDGNRALARFCLIWRLQHDPGELVHRAESERAGRLELTGRPEMDPRLCRGIAGYYEEMFRILELTEARVVHERRGHGAHAIQVFSATW